ncbi:hypothetical protein SAMN05421640_0299 [Ekhidna lutea]|uniref:Lipoprotein n=1 Tax=Ekhidna lutea TaxID=447679 RepID=A0A239ES40_EKHLU|nr:hypothetical protein [Ekhidna lutea]SNS47447.1 hypothetical protein SAMN05421640_0299 [Ekhidna lutea]
MKKLSIILIGLAVISCQDIENCGTDDNLDFMILEFHDLESQSTRKVGFVVTAEGSPYRFSLSEDSTFVALPLNPEDTITTFLFDSDTSHFEVEMRYDPELSIFDPSCDPSITFLNLDTVRYTFDSLSIPGTVTNRQISTNVEVYF